MPSTYPTSVDNPTQLVDGTTFMEGKNVNVAYDALTAVQTMLGASGAAQSKNLDILTFLSNYKAPMLQYSSTSSIDVLAGTLVISNASGSVKVLRKNTSTTNITAANLDTGAMAVGAYYVYAIGDAASTTWTVVFSASATNPSGVYTNYELIGWFYNETAGVLDVTSKFIGNIARNGRYPSNRVSISASTDISNTSVGSWAIMSGMDLRFYYSGLRKLSVRFNSAFGPAGGTSNDGFVRLSRDLVSIKQSYAIINSANPSKFAMHIDTNDTPAAGFYRYTVEWNPNGRLDQRGATDGPRELIVEEV